MTEQPNVETQAEAQKRTPLFSLVRQIRAGLRDDDARTDEALVELWDRALLAEGRYLALKRRSEASE